MAALKNAGIFNSAAPKKKQRVNIPAGLFLLNSKT